jgi:hypothetical protein
LSRALHERRRNVPFAECCFELLDEGKEVISQNLDLRCANILMVACELSVWGGAHRTCFPDLMNSI